MHTDPSPAAITNPDGVAPAMTLCLACGLCCNGTLHAHTALLPAETADVRALGLEVAEIGGRPTFCQPCARFQADRCTIYDRRPQVCRHYACALLQRLQAGKIALAPALRIVAVARKELAIFQARVPDAPSFMRWLKAIEADADAGPISAGPAQAVADDPALANHTAALAIYLTKYFGENEGVSSP